MSAVFLALGAHPPQPFAAPALSAGSGAAASWSAHVSQAMARGWFREPLAAIAARPTDAAGPMATAVQTAAPVLGPSLASISGFVRLGTASRAAPHVPLASGLEPTGTCEPMATPSTSVVGQPMALASPTQPIHDAVNDEKSPSEPVARRWSPKHVPTVHVHVEGHPAGLHVWIGAPLQAGLTAAAVRAALLQAHPDVLPALARIVVNGRDAIGTDRMHCDPTEEA